VDHLSDVVTERLLLRPVTAEHVTAVVAGRQRGLLDATVNVSLPGGRLRIGWAGEGEPVWMTGPAVTVYEGSIDLEAL